MITPTGKYLIVRRILSEKIGSVFLPENLRDDNNTGGPKEWLVLAVGIGRLTKKGVRVPHECKAGDRVITHSFTNGAQPLGNGDFYITEDVILAVLPS